jgi:hypothetical protein
MDYCSKDLMCPLIDTERKKKVFLNNSSQQWPNFSQYLSLPIKYNILASSQGKRSEPRMK